MGMWRCMICGYIYDPEAGDLTQDVMPDTPFEELPAEWVCPMCGALQEDFERMEK